MARQRPVTGGGMVTACDTPVRAKRPAPFAAPEPQSALQRAGRSRWMECTTFVSNCPATLTDGVHFRLGTGLAWAAPANAPVLGDGQKGGEHDEGSIRMAALDGAGSHDHRQSLLALVRNRLVSRWWKRSTRPADALRCQAAYSPSACSLPGAGRGSEARCWCWRASWPWASSCRPFCGERSPPRSCLLVPWHGVQPSYCLSSRRLAFTPQF